MIDEQEKITGGQLVFKMQALLFLTAAIGAPIVILFMFYIAGGGGASLIVHNKGKIALIVIISLAVVSFFLILHAIYMKIILKEASEFLEEIKVALRLVFCLFFEELEITLGNQAVELLNQRAVLHGFTGDIEW